MTTVDNDSPYTIKGNGVEVPRTGYYLITANVYFRLTGSTASDVGVYIRKQASTSSSYEELGITTRDKIPGSIEGGRTCGTGIYYLTDGDIISISVRSTVSATVSPNSAATYLVLVYLGEPGSNR